MSQIWPHNLSKNPISLIQYQWWSAMPIFAAFFRQKWVDFLHFDKIMGKKYFLFSNLSIAAWIRIKTQLSDWKYISGISIPISQIKFVTVYESRFVTIQESNNNNNHVFSDGFRIPFSAKDSCLETFSFLYSHVIISVNSMTGNQNNF